MLLVWQLEEQKKDIDTWETLAETRYSAYDRELTALYKSVKFFKIWIEGNTLVLRTDHKPLIHAFKQKSEKASPDQLRQLGLLSEYTSKIEYIPGEDNSVATAFSGITALTSQLKIQTLARQLLIGKNLHKRKQWMKN